MERVHLIVHGRVQGVFFRAYARDEAHRRGLMGIVRNTSDGCVEIVAEGKRPALEGLIGWCRVGPPAARVDDVDVSWEDFKGDFKDFRISY